MARPDLMHRRDLETKEIISFEILFELVRRKPGFGRRDVVEGLRRALLERARRVQSGRGRRASEARSLLGLWHEITRNGRNVMVQNEGAQACKVVSRSWDQHIGSWMLCADLL